MEAFFKRTLAPLVKMFQQNAQGLFEEKNGSALHTLFHYSSSYFSILDMEEYNYLIVLKL